MDGIALNFWLPKTQGQRSCHGSPPLGYLCGSFVQTAQVVFAKLGGRLAVDFFEDLSEVGGGNVADAGGDPGHGELGIHEKLMCRLAADTVVILQKREAGHKFEGSGKIGFFRMEGASQSVQRKLLFILLAQQFLRGLGQLGLGAAPVLQFGMTVRAGAAAASCGLVEGIKNNNVFGSAGLGRTGGTAKGLSALDSEKELPIVGGIVGLDRQPLFFCHSDHPALFVISGQQADGTFESELLAILELVKSN